MMNDPVLVDARLVFLARAATRLTLVEAGVLDLDTAVADLIPPCACVRDVVERWERQYPPRRRK
jgi:CubicO group peptidase (beta-lactamase class C family)